MALSLLKQNKIDVIFCDWNMPNISGIQLLENIRKSKQFLKQYFVMLTSENEVKKVKKAMAYGIFGYLVKPFSANQVVALLRSIDSDSGPTPLTHCSQVRLLLIEDSKTMRELIISILKKQGFSNIRAVGDAETAQEEFQKGNIPDIVLCDWEMPTMDGLVFLKWMHSKNAVKHIPFVMITSQSKEEKIQAALDTGVDEYLIKPFNPTEIQKKLGRLIRRIKVRPC